MFTLLLWGVIGVVVGVALCALRSFEVPVVCGVAVATGGVG